MQALETHSVTHWIESCIITRRKGPIPFGAPVSVYLCNREGRICFFDSVWRMCVVCVGERMCVCVQVCSTSVREGGGGG